MSVEGDHFREEACSVSQVGQFTTTHWSVVLAAGKADSPRVAQALDRLCRTYWRPIYCYVRRRGYSPEDAQDLTQDFFAHLLSNNRLSVVGPEKGRFRSYLLAMLNHRLSDARDHAGRLKRGGGKVIMSIDAHNAEERYQMEPVENLSPDMLFDRRWVEALIEQVMTRLREEYQQAGKIELFTAIKGFLPQGLDQGNYSQLASILKLSEGAIRVAVHRLRQRFGQLFREEVAATISKPEDIEVEMRHLLAIMSL